MGLGYLDQEKLDEMGPDGHSHPDGVDDTDGETVDRVKEHVHCKGGERHPCNYDSNGLVRTQEYWWDPKGRTSGR